MEFDCEEEAGDNLITGIYGLFAECGGGALFNPSLDSGPILSLFFSFSPQFQLSARRESATMRSNGVPQAQAVAVSLQELIDGEYGTQLWLQLTMLNSGFSLGSVSFETLTEAFGPSSLGIIVVKDLDPKFKELRSQVLSNASYLAALSNDELGKSYPFFFNLSSG